MSINIQWRRELAHQRVLLQYNWNDTKITETRTITCVYHRSSSKKKPGKKLNLLIFLFHDTNLPYLTSSANSSLFKKKKSELSNIKKDTLLCNINLPYSTTNLTSSRRNNRKIYYGEKWSKGSSWCLFHRIKKEQKLQSPAMTCNWIRVHRFNGTTTDRMRF